MSGVGSRSAKVARRLVSFVCSDLSARLKGVMRNNACMMQLTKQLTHSTYWNFIFEVFQFAPVQESYRECTCP